MAVILKELDRANEIANSIVTGKKTWSDLFTKHTFFTKDYKYYLSIVSGSLTKEAQQIWSGLVQSKVRRLVAGIERLETGVKIAHPFNKGFDRVHLCKTSEEIDQVFQGNLQHQLTEEEIEKADIPKDAEYPRLIYTTTYYVGLQLETGEGGRYSAKAKHKLMYCSSQETRHYRARRGFQTPVRRMGAIQRRVQFPPHRTYEKVRHEIEHDNILSPFLTQANANSYDLPSDVFEEGESKPERQKKRAKNGRAAGTPDTTGTDTRKRKSNNAIDSQVSKKPNIADGTNGPREVGGVA
jgi:poly(A) polymerase